jgi:hypothetical protein
LSSECTALVSLEGLALNGQPFCTPTSSTTYEKVLGPVSRVIDPASAPYGHRNNLIHFFDDAGVYLIENHATHLIAEITFVLWPEEAVHRPLHGWTGNLVVGGVLVARGMAESDCVDGTIPFRRWMAGWWSASAGGIHVSFTSEGERQRSGRRSKRRLVVQVSVCFSAATP